MYRVCIQCYYKHMFVAFLADKYFGQTGLVAGVYAGVEYTLERTRGTQDWVC